MPENRHEALSTVYQEVCESYHAIADFRAKLLGLLPLASGVGIFLLLDDALIGSDQIEVEPYLGAIGAFGVVITLGLFFYELRGIQRCNGLIAAGEKLEQQLGVEGQFITRPNAIAGVIGTTLAAHIIYPAVLGGWVYVALVIAAPYAAPWAAILVFVAGFAGSYALNLEAG